MPYIETPDDLAEWMADQLMIFGGCNHMDDCPPTCDHALNTCPETSAKCCRVKFTCEMADRIRHSVANASILAAQQPA